MEPRSARSESRRHRDRTDRLRHGRRRARDRLDRRARRHRQPASATSRRRHRPDRHARDARSRRRSGQASTRLPPQRPGSRRPSARHPRRSRPRATSSASSARRPLHSDGSGGSRPCRRRLPGSRTRTSPTSARRSRRSARIPCRNQQELATRARRCRALAGSSTRSEAGPRERHDREPRSSEGFGFLQRRPHRDDGLACVARHRRALHRYLAEACGRAGYMRPVGARLPLRRASSQGDFLGGMAVNYSLWGQATAPEFESFAGELAARSSAGGFAPAEDGRHGGPRHQPDRRRRSEAVPPPSARHVRRRDPRVAGSRPATSCRPTTRCSCARCRTS